MVYAGTAPSAATSSILPRDRFQATTRCPPRTTNGKLTEGEWKAEHGYVHCGPAGAGHFTKMVHNGIEYGMLQAYGEGFEIIRKSQYNVDLHKLSQTWNHGSVVRSWLLELAERALEKDPRLTGIRGYVEDSGEGRWTVQEAIDLSIPAPVLTLSLQARFASRQEESFSAKVIAALRNEFGGHTVKKAE